MRGQGLSKFNDALWLGIVDELLGVKRTSCGEN